MIEHETIHGRLNRIAHLPDHDFLWLRFLLRAQPIKIKLMAKHQRAAIA